MTPTETEKDILGFEHFKRSELAIDVIATMIGYNINDRVIEKDPLKLNELNKQRDILLTEREQIYSGDKEVMTECIEKYSPIIRARRNK
jgi:hypothetical protein